MEFELIIYTLAFGVVGLLLIVMFRDLSKQHKQEKRDQLVIKNIVKSLDDTTLIR